MRGAIMQNSIQTIMLLYSHQQHPTFAFAEMINEKLKQIQALQKSIELSQEMV